MNRYGNWVLGLHNLFAMGQCINIIKRVAKRSWRPYLQYKRYSKYRRQGIYVAPGTFLHDDVSIGRGTRINAASHVDRCEIGAYCAIAGRLIVRSTNHYVQYLNVQGYLQSEVLRSEVPVVGKSKGPVTIGNGVWIGDSVIVLPGVQIGDGAVVGAGSVVTRSIPAYSIAAGNPARVLKYRYPDEIIKVVRRIHWWEWDVDKMLDNRWIFEVDLEGIDPAKLRSMIIGL
jgi:virginiamycin A acetyltransferase